MTRRGVPAGMRLVACRRPIYISRARTFPGREARGRQTAPDRGRGSLWIVGIAWITRFVMDLKLHRPQSVCSRTGRGFAPGDPFYSALVRAPEGLLRIDVATDAWDEPPAEAIAWWRSVCPEPSAAGPTLAPIDVLLDALEAFEGSEADAAVRYLLALQLVRRRVLKLEGPASDDESVLVFSCRRRECEYRMAVVEPAALADPPVAARLTALLWSGEAA